jgi:hypothetical protein
MIAARLHDWSRHQPVTDVWRSEASKHADDRQS